MKTNLKSLLTNIFSFIVVLISISVLFASTILASDIDPTLKGTITVNYKIENDTNISGVTFYLYKVADVSETGDYSLTGNLSEYPTIQKLLSSDIVLKAAASTIESYMSYSKTSPLMSSITDGTGTVLFSEVDTGLYLLTSSIVTYNDVYYRASPTLVQVPESSGDEWKYDSTVTCSAESLDGYYSSSINDTTDFTVLVVWDDVGYEDKRPDSVTVEMLQNGSEYTSATFGEDYEWKYTWEDLDMNSVWRVVETEVPTGYVVSIEQSGSTFTITNTYDVSNRDTAVTDADDNSNNNASDSSTDNADNTDEDIEVITSSDAATGDSVASDSEAGVEDNFPSDEYDDLPDDIPQTGFPLEFCIINIALPTILGLSIIYIFLMSTFYNHSARKDDEDDKA